MRLKNVLSEHAVHTTRTTRRQQQLEQQGSSSSSKEDSSSEEDSSNSERAMGKAMGSRRVLKRSAVSQIELRMCSLEL